MSLISENSKLWSPIVAIPQAGFQFIVFRGLNILIVFRFVVLHQSDGKRLSSKEFDVVIVNEFEIIREVI